MPILLELATEDEMSELFKYTILPAWTCAGKLEMHKKKLKVSYVTFAFIINEVCSYCEEQ